MLAAATPDVARIIARAFRLGIRFGCGTLNAGRADNLQILAHSLYGTPGEQAKHVRGTSSVASAAAALKRAVRGPVVPCVECGNDYAEGYCMHKPQMEVSVDAVIWFPATWLEDAPKDVLAPDIWRCAIVYGRKIVVKFWRERPPSSLRTKKLHFEGGNSHHTVSEHVRAVDEAALERHDAHERWASMIRGSETGRFLTDKPNVTQYEKNDPTRRMEFEDIIRAYERSIPEERQQPWSLVERSNDGKGKEGDGYLDLTTQRRWEGWKLAHGVNSADIPVLPTIGRAIRARLFGANFGFGQIRMSAELMRDAGFTLCLHGDHCGWHEPRPDCIDKYTRNEEAMAALDRGEFDQSK